MNVSWQTTNGPISVAICRPGPALIGPWNELAARFDANPFMHPAALSAATEVAFAEIRVLLAWDATVTPLRPVGFWALQVRHDQLLMPAFLETLPYDYAFTSNVLIDPARADEVMTAFFDALRREEQLPKTIRLKSFESDPVVYPAMLRQVARTGRHREFFRFDRPLVDRSSGTKNYSKRTRKNVRRVWNRISETGTVEIVEFRTPAEAEAAFETFLALEAASWKGERGTALVCDAGDTRFVRRLFKNLVAQDMASVALLRLDGADIAAQVVFYSGKSAYTWKTAFDAAFAQFSPGILLMSKFVESLLESGRTATIDSCSTADGFLGRLWTGRKTMVDALIDVGPRTSISFEAEAALHQGFEQIGRVRDRLRRALKRPDRTKRKEPSFSKT